MKKKIFNLNSYCINFYIFKFIYCYNSINNSVIKIIKILINNINNMYDIILIYSN